MALTINQEKQIRKARIPEVRLPVPSADLVYYADLARKVAAYRRAQKLPTSKEATEVRITLLAEIDVLLAKLGVE